MAVMLAGVQSSADKEGSKAIATLLDAWFQPFCIMLSQPTTAHVRLQLTIRPPFSPLHSCKPCSSPEASDPADFSVVCHSALKLISMAPGIQRWDSQSLQGGAYLSAECIVWGRMWVDGG
jgi:hypothetical protein